MKVTILGTGALGLALAKVISETKEVSLSMWTKFEEEKEIVKNTRGNDKLLPEIRIKDDIQITTDLKEAVEGSTIIVNCLPFVAVKNTAELLKDFYEGQYICSTTKGMDMDTFETTTEIFENALNTDKVCALSGPSFAIEIATYNPISFVLAGKNQEAVESIYELIKTDNICIDKSEDAVGVQVCGAVKNAIAIGSGILHGMNSADSTEAAYLTRGIKDIMKIITSLRGNHKTIYTYAGVGDLILTCMSEKSRNFSCGKLLGQGYTLEEAIEKLNGKTVEGIKAIESLNNYMKENNLSLDTIPKLYDIIFNKQDIKIIEKV